MQGILIWEAYWIYDLRGGLLLSNVFQHSQAGPASRLVRCFCYTCAVGAWRLRGPDCCWTVTSPASWEVSGSGPASRGIDRMSYSSQGSRCSSRRRAALCTKTASCVNWLKWYLADNCFKPSNFSHMLITSIFSREYLDLLIKLLNYIREDIPTNTFLLQTNNYPKQQIFYNLQLSFATLL